MCLVLTKGAFKSISSFILFVCLCVCVFYIKSIFFSCFQLSIIIFLEQQFVNYSNKFKNWMIHDMTNSVQIYLYIPTHYVGPEEGRALLTSPSRLESRVSSFEILVQ